MNIIPPSLGALRSTYLCDFNWYSGTNPAWVGLVTETNSLITPNIKIGDILAVDNTVGTSFITVANLAFDFTDNWWIVTISQAIGDLGSSVTGNFYIPDTVLRHADFIRIQSRVIIANDGTGVPIVSGQVYTIIYVGTTDFTAYGASSNAYGVQFTSTTTGYIAGTGLVSQAATYTMSSAPYPITVTIDGSPVTFTGLSYLVKAGDATRDIKSTANETTFTLTGVNTAMLSLVLSSQIKGSLIEAWHGFFDSSGALLTTGGTNGLYKFFTGYINSYGINEQWDEELRQYVATISVAASAIQIILRNRIAGRYTNDASWQFFNAGDESMKRVAYVSTITFPFGQTK